MNDIERRVAALVTEKLQTGLTHPGDRAKNQLPLSIPLATFRTTAMPPQLAETVNATTGLIGEAIVHTIQAEGDCTIIDNSELNQLRATAATVDAEPPQRVTVYCRACSNPILMLKVKDGRARVDGQIMLATLSAICPHRST